PLSLNAGVGGAAAAWGSEPTTVTGAGLTTPAAPQPAAKINTAHENAMRVPRRTKRDSTFRHYHLSHEAEVVWARRRTDPADDLHERPARAALRRLRGRAPLFRPSPARPDARDHCRHRGRAVLDVRQARARGIGSEDRLARG